MSARCRHCDYPLEHGVCYLCLLADASELIDRFVDGAEEELTPFAKETICAVDHVVRRRKHRMALR